ncbi:condensation domain-containing protein [Amycolatopsis cihanbeyliensis]|uniref:Condensation domain-containing protein n=1 Tax=Amycolatopsis cihanbeyliensis TaxID=1128664 RepID=A0A542DEX4_AMYCI|nr:condensation domain-containing protein [Amycolatopsis cihanbeyliensis]TQJ01615.1 condensation domain-containing protein [Amycolatopsis cihanbeyliensis]
MTKSELESHRWAHLASTHRGFAFKGPRDPQGRIEEQPWGNAYELCIVSGPVDIVRFARAVRKVVRRQLAFRGRFARRNGEDVFATAEGPLLKLRTLRRGSVSGGSADEASVWVHKTLARCAGKPFRLQHDPLTRVVLAEDADDRWRMLIVQDHSISDGWTLKLLTNAVMQEYRRDSSVVSSDRRLEPCGYDSSYFDWYEGPGQIEREPAEAARKTWQAIADDTSLLAARPVIPGGRWVPRANRLQDRLFLYRFTADEEHRLKVRAEWLGCGLADLLLTSVQLAMLAITRVCPPISYIYSGRRAPSVWRVMGLFCEEMLTVPLPASDCDPLDQWMRRFLGRNHPRPSLGNLSVFDIHSARSEENLVTHFNFLPLRRTIQTDTGVRLDPATREEYEALTTPPLSNRFGIAVKVWDSAERAMELSVSVDHRICPRPDRAALAMLYGALVDGETRISMSEAIETVRSLWSGTMSARKTV